MKKESQYGKNNFDKLEAAGLVAGPDDSENIKAKTEARVRELGIVIGKLQKVEAYLAPLSTLPKSRQLKRLAEASNGLNELLAKKLPNGAKRHVESCVNEVISLREGIYASNTSLDKQTLALTASARARTELQAIVESAQHRLEKVMAESMSENDMDEFYRKAEAVIKKNASESTKIEPIKDKPFVLARVPVIPMDGSISTEKLPQLGFKSESLSGYPVIHNQLVLGINPKMMVSHDPEMNERFAQMSQQLKESGVNPDNITRLRGKVKDLNIDIKKFDDHKGDDPPALANLKLKLIEAESKLRELLEKAGVDPAEIKKVQDQVKRSHAAQPQAIKEERDRLIKLLEKKKGMKLRVVSEAPGRAPKMGGVWFWLMPDRELDTLAKAAFGKRVSITQWGFAF
jgi:hypothetical protein